LSSDQISGELGITVETVDMAMHRLRERLKAFGSTKNSEFGQPKRKTIPSP
jgi:DNA-directed RNA polymerase specialized sigma24 family protein